MFRKIALAAAVLAAGAALAALMSCNSTPTVPVPPPELCDSTMPDGTGLITVSCEAGQTARNIALVYNSDWGEGVMQETAQDGSFSVELEADPGDTLVIQVKYDNRLSNEVSITVPSE